MIDESSGKVITATQIEVAPNLKSLFEYLIDNNFITEVSDFHPDYLRIHPPDALAKLQEGDAGWEMMVPPEVAKIIKERGFFGYVAAPDHGQRNGQDLQDYAGLKKTVSR